jgi:hypothetical protein
VFMGKACREIGRFFFVIKISTFVYVQSQVYR